MLLYKSWLETRWGFVLALAILLYAACFAGVLHYPDAIQAALRDRARHPQLAAKPLKTYVEYIQDVFEGLTLLWSVLAVMLASGGLTKERSLGTAHFLLSLPVDRRKLLVVRSAFCLLQGVVLILVVYLSIPLLSAWAGRTYPASLALQHAALLTAGGVPYIALGVLISTLMSGTYWPSIIGASLVFSFMVSNLARVAPMGVQVLSGAGTIGGGVFPWAGIGMDLAIATAMFGCSIWIVKWQDF